MQFPYHPYKHLYLANVHAISHLKKFPLMGALNLVLSMKLSDGHLSPGITLEPRSLSFWRSSCAGVVQPPVKLVTPEKHRNFVKGILENRHGKASSKESSATDMDPEVLESSPRMMQRKRKREEPSIPSEEDSTVESRFREQGMKLVKKAGIRTADRRTEGQPRGNARNTRNFNGLPTAS